MNTWVASALASFPLLVGCVGASAPADPRAAAPPLKCELNLASWCIAEGAAEITRTLGNDSVHDRVWELKGAFKPQSSLVVMEPFACRMGFAGTPKLLRFDNHHAWRGRSWNRAEVQLKADGTCNLAILLPPDDGDPMEWAYSTGLLLIRPCSAESCVDKSLSDVKSQIGKLRHPLKPSVGD